ncbi:tRNA (5-methylaminomethyl-2-thiouridine)(34)-methyltransferase MnmD [Enterobacter hormaechei]
MNFLTPLAGLRPVSRCTPRGYLTKITFHQFRKFPLTAHDLRLAHQRWPELAHWAEQLQAQWPPAIGGCHRLILDDGRVTLDLWLGDINDLTDKLDDSMHQKVDAWFLDGFAPAKNPDMWSPHLFSAMARLARPGATLATFTSAGFVRRGLQEAGLPCGKPKALAANATCWWG